MKIKRFRFPKDIILLSVRWYLRYGLSYRDLEEMLEERGIFLDHTSISRWANSRFSSDSTSGPECSAQISGEGDEDFACIEIRQCKYLNNILEQDHPNVKRRTRPMLGFKSFWSARVVLAGIELVSMIKKGQLKTSRKTSSLSPADQFYSLAA